MKSSEIIEAIRNSSSSMEKMYDNYEKHGLRYGFISALIRSGIVLDHCMPYLASTVIAISTFSKLDKKPFSKNNIKEYASTYSMLTSNGYSNTLESYDTKYENKSIEYSSGWILNNNNLYERDVIVYRYNDSDKNIDDVLNMTNEEIANLYTICNYKKIQKEILDEEDYIYNEDVIILNKVSNKDTYRVRKQTDAEAIIDTLLFILFIYVGAGIITSTRNILLRETIADKLKRVQKNYRPLSKKEWSCAKKVLEIRKENLELVSEEKSREK